MGLVEQRWPEFRPFGVLDGPFCVRRGFCGSRAKKISGSERDRGNARGPKGDRFATSEPCILR